jgi:hypothetical protein
MCSKGIDQKAENIGALIQVHKARVALEKHWRFEDFPQDYAQLRSTRKQG